MTSPPEPESTGTDRAPSHRVGPGTFVAVVGGSGVGKDSVLGYARDRAAGVAFVQRVITRSPGTGEDSQHLTGAQFAAVADSGGFASTWQAHGLSYGLPISVDAVIRGGGIAIANVSRTVLGGLAARYEHLRVVRVSVSPDVRRVRLAARGREAEHDIAARLDRADPAPDTSADLEIVNNGTIAEAGELLLDFLRELRRQVGTD
ncbi:hypothetical protein GCM10011575_04140 [Microlunatus endophyticus]|uniref:Ribose 1,5-bisphosphate phosphokinase PhnN n=1 Tax=Microlunatus endophyticus TaxID=1716077 RepID=A0A917S0Y6_9ACTN|nr:phosphonate metabolism protein/1,5-bisphosphokinase (PRPP-forming) PhnN [Microlunatus endophyticus]GGL49188.1 hypothetical protein GCM10011575_04140 [Microlunatus endophyticus]